MATLELLDNWGNLEALDAYGTLEQLDALTLHQAAGTADVAVTSLANYDRIFTGVASPSVIVSATMRGKVLGEDWTDTAVGSEVWTDLAAGSEVWTNVSAGTEVWYLQ